MEDYKESHIGLGLAIDFANNWRVIFITAVAW